MGRGTGPKLSYVDFGLFGKVSSQGQLYIILPTKGPRRASPDRRIDLPGLPTPCLQARHVLCLQARHLLCLQPRHLLCQQTRDLQSAKTSPPHCPHRGGREAATPVSTMPGGCLSRLQTSCLLTQQMSWLQTKQMSWLQTQQMSCPWKLCPRLCSLQDGFNFWATSHEAQEA